MQLCGNSHLLKLDSYMQAIREWSLEVCFVKYIYIFDIHEHFCLLFFHDASGDLCGRYLENLPLVPEVRLY